MNTEINCKECIHYEICRHYKEPTDKIKDCDYFKQKNKYIEVPYAIDKEDMIKIYESIANAMTNFVERLKGEQMENKICGNCVHNTYGNGDFLCGNENSDNYGCYIAYDDSCEDFEERN